jgi:hypothetical protein
MSRGALQTAPGLAADAPGQDRRAGYLGSPRRQALSLRILRRREVAGPAFRASAGTRIAISREVPVYRNRRVVLLLGLGLMGCDGSTNSPEGSTTPPCPSLGACECMAASDRCTSRVEACWCPSGCDPQIVCICGGGEFLACEDKPAVGACSSQLAAVETKCASNSFVSFIGELCTSAPDPSCVAGCLADLKSTGSCSEIDCGFCPVCDCAAPARPSPFAACLASCNQTASR